MPKKSHRTDPADMLFREEQRFTQWYIWLLLFGLLAIPSYGILQQVVFKEAFGDNPMSDLGLFIFFLAMLGFCFFFWSIRLKLTVTRDYLHIYFFPFADKKILWKDIERAQIVQYSPWIGYGLRFSTSFGTVYNIKGNKGLFLTLREGKKLMIGTQRPRELEEIALKAVKAV